MTVAPSLKIEDFAERRLLVLQVLASNERLTRKAGSFLGQCAVDPTPLSERQLEWLAQLAERAGIVVEVQ